VTSPNTHAVRSAIGPPYVLGNETVNRDALEQPLDDFRTYENDPAYGLTGENHYGQLPATMPDSSNLRGRALVERLIASLERSGHTTRARRELGS
jgi:hypothetical protein